MTSVIIEPLNEKNWGRDCVIFVSAKMAASRFRSLSEESIAQLLNDKDSENTKMSTKQHRLIFESYLKEKNIRNPTTAVELAAVLRKFYTEAREKDGQMYSKNSLCSIRFSLCRHFKQELNVDIIKDAEFDEANRVYGAQCVELKKQASENCTIADKT